MKGRRAHYSNVVKRRAMELFRQGVHLRDIPHRMPKGKCPHWSTIAKWKRNNEPEDWDVYATEIDTAIRQKTRESIVKSEAEINEEDLRVFELIRTGLVKNLVVEQEIRDSVGRSKKDAGGNVLKEKVVRRLTPLEAQQAATAMQKIHDGIRSCKGLTQKDAREIAAATGIDFSGWTTEEMEHYCQTGEQPDER